jgi:hypothetical protein
MSEVEYEKSYCRGRSSSDHNDAATSKIVSSCTPDLGTLLRTPMTGGLFTAMDNEEEAFRSVLVKYVKVST